MAKANPKAWFTSPLAKITYKSVDKTAEMWKKHRPYFDTWQEAWVWMMCKANDRLAKAEKELRSAKAFRDKVKAMTAPTTDEAQHKEKA